MAAAQYATDTPAKLDSPVAPGNGTSAWRECCEKVLQAAMHGVYLHPDDAVSFHKKLMESMESLKGEPGDDVVRKCGEDVAAELERHNRSTQKAVTKAMSELRDAAAALSKGLRSFAGQSDLGAHLESLQALFSNATTPDEISSGRSKVEELIGLMASKERDRTTRQEEFVQELQARIEQLESANCRTAADTAREIAVQAPTTDSLTGVPNGVAAREAILNAQTNDRPPHVAIMHIQSLDVLNARFGQRIGDQIVLTCCQHLASNLCRETDRIFRWRGPAFVALLDRDDSPAGVAREVSHACNSIASSFFGEPHRSILIPVKMASTTVPMEGRLITDVFDSVERFIVRAGRPTS